MGDLQFYDIIIFAGIAAFLIYRMRKVLGKRTGFVKQNNDIIKPAEQEIKKEIPELKPNELNLSKAYDAMEAFDHKKFLEGAKFAFETIINAFNQGDKNTLRKLLNKDVYTSFEEAIELGNNNPNFQFYSLVIDLVEDVIVDNGLINIILVITSEQFKDNDEATITKKQDKWTFQKNIKDKSPIWYLAST